MTVSPEFAGATPTGTVSVTESGTPVCVITLAEATGTCNLTADAAAGSYPLVATYSGDGDFKTSASVKRTLVVTS